MKKISEALRKKGVSSKSLPEELQDEIAKLREDIIEYNNTCEQYEKEKDEEEPDEEAEKKLDDLADSLAEREIEISEKVLQFEPQPEPAAAPAAAPAPAAPAKKEDSSVGWLIFGGVVLALTLGAVNLMKKR